MRRQRDTYRDMLFKANRKEESIEEENTQFQTQPKRKRGGQFGHSGHGRKLPLRVDKMLHITAEYCPTCKASPSPDCSTVQKSVSCYQYECYPNNEDEKPTDYHNIAKSYPQCSLE